MTKKTPIQKTFTKKIITILLSCMLLFVAGGYYWYTQNPTGSLEKIFPQNTSIFFRITPSNAQNLSPQSQTKLQDLITSFMGKPLHSEDFQNWIGNEIGIAFLEDKSYVIGIKTKNKSLAKKFITNFRLEDEKFIIKKFPKGDLWTPEFSSNLGIGFRENYLLFSPTQKSIEVILIAEQGLQDNPQFLQIKKDFQLSSFADFYIDHTKALSWISSTEYESYFPVLEALAKNIPASAGSFSFKENELLFSGRAISSEKIFLSRRLENTITKGSIPPLAMYAPKDTKFFVTGVGLREKYEHTKGFLHELDPQFALIFESAIRAKTKEVFGEEFDFEKNFLSKTEGNYALIFDREADFPFLRFSLITGIKRKELETNMENFKNEIKTLQGKFTPKVQEVKLLDGSTREEIVAMPKEEVVLEEEVINGTSLWKTKVNGDKQKNLSFVFLNQNLGISLYDSALKKIILNEKNGENFEKNENFVKSVFFYFPPAETYGFWKFQKSTQFRDIISAFKTKTQTISLEPENESLGKKGINLLFSEFDSVAFSKRVFAHEIIWNAVFFEKK